MNHENFNPESAVKFPLSKTRMAELQSDIQAPLQLLATMLPLEDCIVAGCDSAGDPGYAILGLSDGNDGTVYEVLEVRASSGGTNTYLNLQTSPVYAQNGNGENVLVRTERYLEWGTNQDNTNAPARTYADMKRLWVKKARQDDSNWRNCTNGTNWTAGVSGNLLRVSYAGGRVHLAGQLTYLPYLRVTQRLIDTGYFASAAQVPAVGTLVKATGTKSIYNQAGVLSEVKQSFELSFVGNTMKLPSGYRPAGDVLVPVLYNDSPACAIVDSDGVLTLDRDPEIGDTIKIDTYFEI